MGMRERYQNARPPCAGLESRCAERHDAAPMKLLRIAPIALLLACGGPHTVVRMSSVGQTETVAEAEAEAEAAQPTPRVWLWEVSGGDAASPSYVLGTMHIGVRMNVALPAPL